MPVPAKELTSLVEKSRLFPQQTLLHLDALWIQVAGTLCNLTCAHCFVPSGPDVHRHELVSRSQVRERVAEAVALGVREIYFTGGEPFLHPDLLAILEDTLAWFPATVLTNGTLFTRQRVAELARLSTGACYSLEIRVSLDGRDAESHDRLRGTGAFERTLEGLRRLERAGLLPIVTATRMTEEDPLEERRRWMDRLRGVGLSRPRLKILPLFKLGREVERSGDYDESESLAGLSQRELDPTRLQCGGCRAITSRGVFVCPLLVDEPSARMGSRLAEALGPFKLAHGACFTCYVTGMTCSNG